MTAPRIYDTRDAGCPWPHPSMNSSHSHYQCGYLSLYGMLRAALVDGYAGKPAAGWTMAFDEIAAGTGWRYALTNAGQSGYLVINPGPTKYGSMARVCESLADLDNLVNDWSYFYSETFGGTGARHWLHGYNAYYSEFGPTKNYQICIVANNNGAMVWFYDTRYINGYNNTAGAGTGFYFGTYNGSESLGTMGAPASRNFCVVGGQGYNSADHYPSIHTFGSTSQTVLSHVANQDGTIFTAANNRETWADPTLGGTLNYQKQAEAVALCPMYLVRSDYTGTSASYDARAHTVLGEVKPVQFNVLSPGGYSNQAYVNNVLGGEPRKEIQFQGKSMVYLDGIANSNAAPWVSLEAEDWA